MDKRFQARLTGSMNIYKTHTSLFSINMYICKTLILFTKTNIST